MHEDSDQHPIDEPPAFAPGEVDRDAGRMPTPPVATTGTSQPRPQPHRWGGRIFSLAIGLLGLSVLAGLLFLGTLFNPAVLLIAGGVFAFGAVHYLIWGWWLGYALQQQALAEQKEKREAGLNNSR
ncbi:MAG: hypothetical protein WBF93_00900 [Pirellulales bacterium]|nr:hypothetical protein [Pirellulales bacterium]